MVKRTQKRARLSEAVASARCARFLTQQELAEEAGVSAGFVANIERGQVLTITRLSAAKLGRALGISLAQYIRKTR